MTDKASFPNVIDCGSAASLELRGGTQPARRRISLRDVSVLEHVPNPSMEGEHNLEEMEASKDGGRAGASGTIQTVWIF